MSETKLIVDILVNSDEEVTFVVEGALPADIVSVVYYRAQRLVTFSFADDAIDDYLVEAEVPDSVIEYVDKAGKTLIVHTKGEKILGGFDVPLIQVG